VTAQSLNQPRATRQGWGRAVTDAHGAYRMEQVGEGDYNVMLGTNSDAFRRDWTAAALPSVHLNAGQKLAGQNLRLIKGVVVNTIHCGSRDEGMSGAWHDGAALGGGKFMVINQDRAVVDIAAPQDKRIAELGVELNKTYLGYGKERAAGAAKQEAADKDAATFARSGAPVARAMAKASANYHNATWDLVDAVREKQVDPAKLEPADLPEAMRGLKPEERAAFVEKAGKERAEIQGKIVTLNREREAFVAEEMKKRAKETGEKTLDQAIVETTREQAAALGYTFGK